MSEYGEELPYKRPTYKVYATDLHGNRVVHEVYGNIPPSDIARQPWFDDVKEIHDVEVLDGSMPLKDYYAAYIPPIGSRNEKQKSYEILRHLKPMDKSIPFELGTIKPEDWPYFRGDDKPPAPKSEYYLKWEASFKNGDFNE